VQWFLEIMSSAVIDKINVKTISARESFAQSYSCINGNVQAFQTTGQENSLRRSILKEPRLRSEAGVLYTRSTSLMEAGSSQPASLTMGGTKDNREQLKGKNNVEKTKTVVIKDDSKRTSNLKVPEEPKKSQEKKSGKTGSPESGRERQEREAGKLAQNMRRFRGSVHTIQVMSRLRKGTVTFFLILQGYCHFLSYIVRVLSLSFLFTRVLSLCLFCKGTVASFLILQGYCHIVSYFARLLSLCWKLLLL